jgi:hypothetical protein
MLYCCMFSGRYPVMGLHTTIYNVFHSPVIFPLGVNIFMRTSLQNLRNFCTSISVRDHDHIHTKEQV